MIAPEQPQGPFSLCARRAWMERPAHARRSGRRCLSAITTWAIPKQAMAIQGHLERLAVLTVVDAAVPRPQLAPLRHRVTAPLPRVPELRFVRLAARRVAAPDQHL